MQKNHWLQNKKNKKSYEKQKTHFYYTVCFINKKFADCFFAEEVGVIGRRGWLMQMV